MTQHDLLPYRPCVGIMLINHAGLVWVGKRFGDKNPVPDETAWQMPQGGLDKGEDPLEAAKRELYEETSVSNVSLLAEAPEWYAYDFPEEVLQSTRRGKYRGQTQKWFAMRFEGMDSEINILTPPDGHGQEFCEWRWERAENLPGLIVPFKREVYAQVVGAFKHLTV
ncbi:RNA pyrophosphohydrolase [Pseudovibrio sp. SPO723]|uniref:RNA pyrophosphohydrolase n=1 Tax=Nesiotobacter zosterae TaxID=392721 RepID=UPI0029C52AFB|nr:RNA pyrophosphohydrolase [Pseudovibrio sp. SPO723]MDX5592158.1 RNA pyrophosphohydrolase [Pseudovibrio sp. SPO723]